MIVENNNIINITKENQIKDFLNSIHNKIDYKSSQNDLQNVMFPLYYMFDGDISSEIGSSSRIRSIIRDFLKLDNIFKLDPNNIIDVPNESHATLFYRMNIKENNYLFYYNSGLGTKYNVRTNDGKIAPRIFLIKDPKLYENIPLWINSILNIICVITNEKLDKINELYLDKIKNDIDYISKSPKVLFNFI